MRLICGLNQSFEFRFTPPFSGEMVGKGAGMKLDELRARFCGCSNLRGIGRYEQAHLDPAIDHFFGGFRESSNVSANVQAAFSRDFLPFFGHQADDLGLELESDLHNLGRCRHFQVQPGFYLFTKLSNVTVLDVTAVFAQMGGNPMGTCALALECGSDRVRFPRSTPAITRFADRCYMIDVHAELEHKGSPLCPTCEGLANTLV